MTGPSSLPTGPGVAEPQTEAGKALADWAERTGFLYTRESQRVHEAIAAIEAEATARASNALLWKALLLRDWLEWALTDPRPERQHGLRQAAAVLASTASLATSATSADAIEDALDAAAVEHEFVPYSAQNNLTCRVCHRYRDIDRHGLAAPAGDAGPGLREALLTYARDFHDNDEDHAGTFEACDWRMCRDAVVLAANPPTWLCSAIWNGCVCGRPPHGDDRHVWLNTLDHRRAVDPTRYPVATASTGPDGPPIGPVRIRSANCVAEDHADCAGMVEQDLPELGLTDCLCQCHGWVVKPATASTGPTGLDVERLAEALFLTQTDRRGPDGMGLGSHEADAAYIASVYDAMRPTPPAQPETDRG